MKLYVRKWSIEEVSILLFQLSIIANSVLGMDKTLYVIPKIIVVLFFTAVAFFIIKTRYITFNVSVIFPTMFMVISAASYLWAEYPEMVEKQMITQIQLFILFIFVYALCSNVDNILPKYFDAIYFSGIALVGYALFKYHGISGYMLSLSSGMRMGGEITNENVFGMFFSEALIVAFFYLITTKRKIHIFMIAVFTIFALSSGSKKAVLMIVFGIVAICILEFGLKRIWKILLFIAVSGIILYVILQLPEFSTINERLMSYLTGNLNTSDRIRANAIDIGMNLIKERPILGYGIQNYIRISGLNIYSHNNFIEIAVSLGIIGLVLYYIPYLQMIKIGISNFVNGNKRNKNISMIFVLTVISFVFGYGMVQFYDKDCWIMLGLITAVIGRWQKKKPLSKEDF